MPAPSTAPLFDAPVAIDDLTTARLLHPGAIKAAAARRVRPQRIVPESGRLLIVAADHPARGALGAGARGAAMADRRELLRRLEAVLADPRVDGVLGTPDVLEDLLLMGAADGKLLVGSMNRGGLQRAAFEIDDRYTAFTPASLEALGCEAGKLLLRIDMLDPATADALENCAGAVTGLAERDLIAMVEPFMSRRVDGHVANELTAEAMVKAISISAGLGATSSHTWLKVPWVDGIERALAATTLPCLLLGGEVSDDPARTYARWSAAFEQPNMRGLVLGRSLLFPHDDDVPAALDAAAAIVAGA